MRYPSYLISCSQSSPAGASSATRVSCGLIHFGGSDAFPTETIAAHATSREKSRSLCCDPLSTKPQSPHNASPQQRHTSHGNRQLAPSPWLVVRPPLPIAGVGCGGSGG